MPLVEIGHQGPEELVLGAVVATGVSTDVYPDSFESDLEALLNVRQGDLDNALDEWRRDVRDVFRNGRFKPTGRGKPASEYLLGAARKGAFPRINSLVDVCNYVSLRYVLPISLCDMDRAGASRLLVRLGLPGEEYVFNSAEQTIALEDLIVGCVVGDDGDSHPVVNAVKDSMGTKTGPESSRICALLYAPHDDVAGRLDSATSLFAQLIKNCGPEVRTAKAIITQGETAFLDSEHPDA